MANESSLKGAIWTSIIGAMALIVVAVINRGAIFGTKPAPTESFVGIVQDDRLPLQGASVRALIGNQPQQITYSDSDGGFHFQVPRETATMHIWVSHDGFEPIDRDVSPQQTQPEIVILKKSPKHTSVASPAQIQHPHDAKPHELSNPPIVAVNQTTTAPCPPQSAGGNASTPECNPVNTIKPTITWTPDGVRTTTAGTQSQEFKPFAESAFVITHQFQENGDWTGLLNWSQTWQKVYPDWHTPDYFAAIADANLCDLQKSRDLYKKFIDETKADAAYKKYHDRAVTLLSQLDIATYEAGCR
jgi:hypothetical protein